MCVYMRVIKTRCCLSGVVPTGSDEYCVNTLVTMITRRRIVRIVFGSRKSRRVIPEKNTRRSVHVDCRVLVGERVDFAKNSIRSGTVLLLRTTELRERDANDRSVGETWQVFWDLTRSNDRIRASVKRLIAIDAGKTVGEDSEGLTLFAKFPVGLIAYVQRPLRVPII